MDPYEIYPPFVSARIEGIGGVLKHSPDDFAVDEIPAYQPEGEGEHLIVRLTKRGITTREVQKELAQVYGVSERDVGYAGLKDKHALATQYFSVWLKNQNDPERAYALQERLPVRVHSTGRHRNKMKPGHLRGNTFSVRISGLSLSPADAAARAREIAGVLERHGVPNIYGPQRFGTDGGNAQQGYELLRGERTVRKKWLRRLLLSAYQSYLFNYYVLLRFRRGLYRSVVAGDIAQKYDTGGIFQVENEAAEQLRLEAGEICYTGPIFGKKMKPASGAAGELEEQTLEDNTVSREELCAAKVSGSRRMGIVIPRIGIEEEEQGICLDFTLPKGAFATVVLREIMKTSL